MDDLSAIQTLIDEEMEWAKRTKRLLGYSRIDNFPARLTLVRGTHHARVPGTWGDEDEKRKLMAKIGYIAKAMAVDVVMLASDMRMVNSQDFSEHFKIPHPTPATSNDDSKKFMAKYQEIMERYDFQMVNLPRHLWTESIAVVAKWEGGVKARMTPYTRGSGKQVMFIEPKQPIPGDDDKFQMLMLRDWWKIPDDDPTLARAQEILRTEHLEQIMKERRA